MGRHHSGTWTDLEGPPCPELWEPGRTCWGYAQVYDRVVTQCQFWSQDDGLSIAFSCASVMLSDCVTNVRCKRSHCRREMTGSRLAVGVAGDVSDLNLSSCFRISLFECQVTSSIMITLWVTYLHDLAWSWMLVVSGHVCVNQVFSRPLLALACQSATSRLGVWSF